MQPWLAFRRYLLQQLQSVMNSAARLVFFVEVRPHHFAPSATALAERPRSDPVQGRCSGVQVCLHGTAPSYVADDLQCPADFEARRLAALHLIITDCPSYMDVHCRRSGLPCCRRPHLEQSASTRHVRTLYVCFPRTLEGF